jgi:hypothetical protein
MSKKEVKKNLNILRTYNRWRRGADIEQPNPKTIGEALDEVLTWAENILKKK